MAAAEKYAEWIVANQAKKGTPEFETVVQAYKAARAGQSAPEPEEKPPVQEPTDWLREAALGGKALFKGVASLPMAFADFQDLPKSVASKITGQPYQAPSERLGAALDQYTYSPRDQNERLASDTIEGVSGGIVGGPGKVGLNMLAGGAGGLAAGAAREGGGGPIAQIVAAILASAGVGGATRAGKIGANIVDSAVLPGGGKRAAVRATAEIIGDEAQRKAVADALMRAKKGQTAAQAAAGTGNTEIAALQKIARDSAGTKFQAIDDAQQASRAARIGEIAGTPDELIAAKEARKAIADPLYDAARAGGGIDAKQFMAKIDRLISDNPGNRELLSELKNIRNGLIANRKTGALHTDAQKLASVVDGMKSAMADEKNKFILENLSELKNDLRSLIPGFAEADAAFAGASKPINRMVAGATLEKALTSGTGRERATTFTNAVKNAESIPELQTRSGANRFRSISEVLDEPDMAKVREVSRELATDARVDDLVSAGMPKVGPMYRGELEGLSFPQMLARPVMLANAALNRAQGVGAKRTTRELAEYMSPETVREFGRALKDYSKDDIRKLIVEAIMAGSAGGIAAGRE